FAFRSRSQLLATGASAEVLREQGHDFGLAASGRPDGAGAGRWGSSLPNFRGDDCHTLLFRWLVPLRRESPERVVVPRSEISAPSKTPLFACGDNARRSQ